VSTRDIRIEEFSYDLPDERIAKYPLEKREESKLLIYKDGLISDSIFSSISNELHEGDLLVSNNTRVIAARLFFRKKTGASIEIFCLEPVGTSHQDAMMQRGKSIWKCLVGGAKKWKGDEKIECVITIEDKEEIIYATRMEQTADAFIIAFEWNNNNIPFSEVLHTKGELPLPPYFNRKAEQADYDRYQTVFAIHEGSVAAPTAGLHFTLNVLQSLKEKAIMQREVTLHVGAGTFKPVSSETMEGHTMHSEAFSVSVDLLKDILNCKGRIIPVGTTSMRTLESLYWLGVKMLSQQKNDSMHNSINQWEPYQLAQEVSLQDSFEALINCFELRNEKDVNAATSILIAPGYKFRVCDGIITNFHMPKSTLLLLVAAFIGEDWKSVYDYAMKNDFRFLSYGDSSLLWRNGRN